MASIRKRSWATTGGETRTAWVVDYADKTGRRRLKTFKTKKAADAWRTQAQGELARGIHVPDSVSATVTEAAAGWIDRCVTDNLERATIDNYRQHLDLHILPRLGREKLSRLTVPLIESYKDELLQTRSRPMARKILSSLKSLLKDAQRRGLTSQNVASAVSIGTNNRHEHRPEVGVDIPSTGEVEKLINAASSSLRWRAFLMLACFTGMRSSELRGLTWANVDFEADVVRIRQRADRYGVIGRPKSRGSRRDITMAPMVKNTLREWKLASGPNALDLVFPSDAGKIIQHGVIRHVLAPIHVKAGLVDASGKRPKYGLHAFRHFFASWLIDRKLGPKRIQALMGHATISQTFDGYGHLFPAENDQELFAAGELAVMGISSDKGAT